MAVNRAVSSHAGRVGLTQRMARARVPESAIIRQGRWSGSDTWGGGSAECPGLTPPTWRDGSAALALGLAWLGTRWAADVAERIEGTWPRLLSALRRIYLGGRPGEPRPHGQNRRLPRFTYSISTWPNKLLGTHPLNRLLSRTRCSKLPRLPNSGGISPFNWLLPRNSPVTLPRRPNSGGISSGGLSYWYPYNMRSGAASQPAVNTATPNTPTTSPRVRRRDHLPLPSLPARIILPLYSRNRTSPVGPPVNNFPNILHEIFRLVRKPGKRRMAQS